ncbi:hypothetical protein IQ235_05215 [Oscillatoriales cyanobacterium LEGE 11467]|uniref:Uncharacterized protein n=1 Tax=Zarconia navalis LEGE 11467 TaxID=1828826 RepID=A0A928VU47_9CYAN|nr:hypothetical protein [Zarconia navalis]MBE9040191.1 hypothetical protein [Zarconia navalis LEGE 11467]
MDALDKIYLFSGMILGGVFVTHIEMLFRGIGAIFRWLGALRDYITGRRRNRDIANAMENIATQLQELKMAVEKTPTPKRRRRKKKTKHLQKHMNGRATEPTIQ